MHLSGRTAANNVLCAVPCLEAGMLAIMPWRLTASFSRHERYMTRADPPQDEAQNVTQWDPNGDREEHVKRTSISAIIVNESSIDRIITRS
mmetsp:Transcript_19518/g.42401  ORF Transcript_19518/g.42401 Transcript_19518/m.42401 type:complete len:91 (-) Transcript_19518:2557-2829(-)